MAITKATAQAVAPAAKGDLVVGSATNDASVLGVGTDGQVLTADATQATGLKWSTPVTGLNFTLRVNGDGLRIREIAYNGSNLYVAVGAAGKLLTSPDGITWTSRTSGFGSNTISSIAYGNGLWVAVGANGTITTSTDGTTWTARTSNMGTNQIIQVKYENSIWVAVGAGGGATNTGGITYSTDGITWTRKSQSLTVGTTYYDVGWNGTNWIVCASNSTNNYLYASTPSGTWTAGADGSAQQLAAYFWDGTRNIILNAGGTFRYSTSATLGTTTSYSNLFGWYPGDRGSENNKYYNGKMYLNMGTTFGTFTPASTNQVWMNGDVRIAPTVYLTGDGSASITGTAGCYWVGSTGIIATTTQGTIFTSF